MAHADIGQVKRLHFVSFGEEEKQPAVPAAPVEHKPVHVIAPPAPPAITAKDMENAKEAASAQGVRAGRAEAEAEIDREAQAQTESMRSLMDVIANRITIAAETHTDFLKSQQHLSAKLAIAIAKKLAGEALRREPYANVEALLRECTNILTGAPKIVLCVPPAAAASLRQRIDDLRALLEGFEGQFIIEEDAGLGDQGCRVEWKNGYAERNAVTLWSELEALIARTTLNVKEGG